LTPEVGGRSSHPNHALACRITSHRPCPPNGFPSSRYGRDSKKQARRDWERKSVSLDPAGEGLGRARLRPSRHRDGVRTEPSPSQTQERPRHMRRCKGISRRHAPSTCGSHPARVGLSQQSRIPHQVEGSRCKVLSRNTQELHHRRGTRSPAESDSRSAGKWWGSIRAEPTARGPEATPEGASVSSDRSRYRENQTLGRSRRAGELGKFVQEAPQIG
jgi:hypothetical protein